MLDRDQCRAASVSEGAVQPDRTAYRNLEPLSRETLDIASALEQLPVTERHRLLRIIRAFTEKGYAPAIRSGIDRCEYKRLCDQYLEERLGQPPCLRKHLSKAEWSEINQGVLRCLLRKNLRNFRKIECKFEVVYWCFLGGNASQSWRY